MCESVVYDTPLQMEVACSRDRQLDNLLPIRDLDFFAFRLEQAVVNKCGGKVTLLIFYLNISVLLRVINENEIDSV